MPGNSIPLLNDELTESAREHRERELLERIDARDREAMREFYLLYHHRLTRFLNRMTCRHELIDEMINDTLFVVWEKAGDFRGDSRVSTWIMAIAYRRGLNLMRAEYRAQERMALSTTEDQHLLDPVADQSDLAELVERALEGL